MESLAATANVELPEDRIQSKFEPQVAVKCGFLNQYLLENGHWSVNKDGDATCLTGRKLKAEVLAICRKVYPEREIRNIVESSRNVLIGNMCHDGERSSLGCKSQNWVKPYRCLEGNFQSDALLVPSGCNFSHTYDKRQCKEFNFWNETAQEACVLKGLVPHSFGVLVPCGIDLFSGVEYVCCPEEMEEQLAKDASTMDTGVVAEERSRTRQSAQEKTVAARRDASDSGDNWEDDYFRGDDEQTEHEKYKAALEKLKKHHQERIDKMMKEWTDVSARYKDLKKSDPDAAKKLKSDLMSRVRKTMTALENEFEDQKRQLVELHQQRIEVRLNDRKRESMDHYLDAIQESHPRVTKLLTNLEKYIKAEEKDRQHSLNRFRHLLNSDPTAAMEEEPSVLSHLRDLDQRVNESMKMLNRVSASVGKEVERKARIYWKDLRNSLFGYGISNDQLVIQYKQQVTAHRQRDHISRQRKLEDQFDQLEEVAESDDDEEADELQNEPESEKKVTASSTTIATTTTAERRVIDKEGLSFRPLDRQHIPVRDVEVFVTSPTTVSPSADVDEDEEDVENETPETNTDPATDPATDDEEDALDTTDTERESENVDVLHKLQDVSATANVKLHRMEEEPQYSSLQRIAPEEAPLASKVLYIGLGLAGVALLAFISLAIVLLRRRSPSKEGFAPVDTFASPEEKHVANMQAHGYTNPFFNHAHQYSKA